MSMNDLTYAISEGLAMMGKSLIVIVIGLIGYALLKYYVEPWVIEVSCRELVKCG